MANIRNQTSLSSVYMCLVQNVVNLLHAVDRKVFNTSVFLEEIPAAVASHQPDNNCIACGIFMLMENVITDDLLFLCELK